MTKLNYNHIIYCIGLLVELYKKHIKSIYLTFKSDQLLL